MKMANDQVLSLLWHVRLSLFPEGELPPAAGLQRDKAEQKYWWILYVIDMSLEGLKTGAQWNFTRFGPKDVSALSYRMSAVFSNEPAMRVGVKGLRELFGKDVADKVDSVLELWSTFWDYKEYWQVFEMEYPELYEQHKGARQLA